MDNNLSTKEDRELFARIYSKSTWGEAKRITDNNVSDSYPKAVWLGGEWFITWYQDGSIMYKIGLDGETKTEDFLQNVQGDYEVTLKQGEKPQVVVVYKSIAENSVQNLSASFYDVEYGVWSDEISLIKGDGFVKSFSPVFTEDKALNIAYTQAAIVNEVINGEEYKNVSDKVNLHMLTYTTVHDLALSETDGILLDNEIPMPDTLETVSVTILNQGDFAEVATLNIYDGNPAAGGVKIGEATTAQPIPARSSAEINVEWLVDQAEKSEYDIYAVVKPENGVTEINSGNNTISRKFTTADIAVTALKCDNIAGDDYLVTATVANRGSRYLDNIRVQLDQGTDKAIVETKELGHLNTGEEMEFSLIISSEGLSKDENGKTNVNLRVLLPEAVTENSYDNNKYEFVLESASIVLDKADPAQSEKQAAIEKPLTLSFNMNVEAGAGFEQITLTDEELNKIDISKTLEGDTLTVITKNTLAYGTQYTLTIPEDALGDSYGHTMQSSISISFTTTASSPEIIFAYPGNGTDEIALDEEIKIEYNQEISAGPTFENITMTGPDSKQISTSVTLQGKWLYIRPSVRLSKNSKYSVMIPKGAIENEKGELQQEDYELVFLTAEEDNTKPPEDNSSTDTSVSQTAYRLSRQMGNDRVSTATIDIDEQTVMNLKTEGAIAVLDISGDVKEDGVIKVNLSQSALRQLVKNNLGLRAITGKGDLYLPADLIKQLEETEENIITVTIGINKKRLKDEGKVSTAVFDFLITAGTKAITEFNTEVICTIPLDMSKVGNTKRVIACVYDEASGTWQPVGGVTNSDTGTLTFGTGHFSTYAAFETVKIFEDVTDSWAKDKIEILASRYLINGTTDKTYSPEDRVTRGEFATLIVKSLYMKLTKSKGTFSDVAEDSWYADAVETAYSLGFVSGTGPNSFEPDAEITREQMAVLVYRLYQYKFGKKSIVSFNNTFKDRQDISQYAEEAVNFTAAKEIMMGSDGRFEPQRSTTRQEAAVVLYRLLEYMGEL